MNDQEKEQRTELEAAVFRRLVAHFQKRTDVQNIDLMILSGFCRNCLSKWMVQAAEDIGTELSLEQARERVYGIPYEQWKDAHQTPATEEQKKQYQTATGKKL